MSSVQAFGKWMAERPHGGPSNVVQQIRLDEHTATQIAYLSQRFGTPKATLAAELLRAAVKDVMREIPGNMKVKDHPIGDELVRDYGFDPEDLVHEMGGSSDGGEIWELNRSLNIVSSGEDDA